MWIIRNLRCHYLQNTITNSEKIFDTNSINHFTNIAKVLRGGVSELIGNYEYLRILPQPSEVKTFGMVMIRNCFTNVIKVFKGGVSYQTGKYEYLHILPQPGEVKNFGMATIRNCLFGMKLRSKYFRKEYILSKNYRAELVGLFGNPVDENPTGPMMEAGFAAQGLNYRYITMKVEKENLKDAIAGIRAIGMRGLNLTIPHKIAVIPFLDELSPAAKIIGAVNSIRVQDGQLIGENTDGKGFVTSLMETGIELNGRIITVLGSGGAARAVAVECAISGAETVNIVARNEERGKELADLISEKTEAQGVYFTWKGSVPIPEGTEVLVNCTNVGLYPDENKPDITYEDIRKNMTVCDVVFNPPETKFLKEAKARGAATVNGLGMLVNQAALNYCLWTENMAPKDMMKEALLREFNLENQTVQEEKTIQKNIAIQEKVTKDTVKNMENTRRTPGRFQATQGEENIMDEQDRKLIEKMMEYYAGDPKRVQHFLKVYEFAKLIGESESLDTETMHILRTAAIVHDIGIKISEEKYGSSNGKYQEKEGPAVAEPMLLALGYDEAVIDRVLFLIAHHHTYNEIEGLDYQILVEADFLVNLFEDGSSREAAQKVQKNIFKTNTGTKYLSDLFLN